MSESAEGQANIHFQRIVACISACIAKGDRVLLEHNDAQQRISRETPELLEDIINYQV